MRGPSLTVPLALLALSAGPAVADELNLRCTGTADMPNTAPGPSATIHHPDGSSSRAQFSGTLGNKVTPTVIRVQLNDESGQIQLPKAMLPGLALGGRNGWWSLYDVAVSQDQISGRYRLTPLNKPIVRIDRISGDISVAGILGYAFQGTCEPEDRSAENRKF